MNKEIDKTLEKIAEGLGVAVDKLYPILYKQAMIDTVLNVIWILFFAIGIFVFYKTVRFILNKQKNSENFDIEWDWDEPRQILILTVGILFTLVGTIVILVSIYDVVTALFNTEYYMIKKILSQVKSG